MHGSLQTPENVCVSVYMEVHPCVINPNDNPPFSIKLVPLVQSAISVAKPQCDCRDLSFGKKIIRDDYCVVAQATSSHPLL